MDKRQEIEKVAYELYAKGGYISGHEMDHWFEAERIVHSRTTAAASFKAKKGSSAVSKKSKASPAKKRV
jgi:hypothetical protein